jgi:6-phosphogluconolactonase
MDSTLLSSQPLLFVGGYGPASQPGIHAFAFDAGTGALAAHGSFAGIANPSFLVVHPNRRWLYAVSETSQQQDGVAGSVWALRLERAAGATRIESINQRLSGGDLPCHLELDSTSRWLLVSNYGSGSVGLFPILPDGALGEMADLVQHRGSGPNPKRQAGPHAHSATLSRDNAFVIVADLGIDQLVTYKFDSPAGRLLRHSQTNARSGAGPRHIAFHPSGQHVYVANELNSTVIVYEYDLANGTLREVQTVDTLPPGAPENLVAHVQVSASGQRVYVSNRGHDSLAVFQVEADGRLARAATPSCGGKEPRHFALAPDGQFVLVANQSSNEVSVLPVLAGGLELGPATARAVVLKPSCVQFVAGHEEE